MGTNVSITCDAIFLLMLGLFSFCVHAQAHSYPGPFFSIIVDDCLRAPCRLEPDLDPIIVEYCRIISPGRWQVDICMYTYIYMYIHIHKHIHIHIHIYVYTYAYIRIYTQTYAYIRIHTHTDAYIHTHTYTYIYIHIHT